MSADSWCDEDDLDERFKHVPSWMKAAIGERCCACQFDKCPMADPTNLERSDDADDDGVEKEEDIKMAAEDEKMRVLRYIAAIWLDRPCPSCKYEGFDRPHSDLRQCRACGELWGLDDSQTMDELVREFGRMDPCQGCGTSGLDDFQIADKHGRQELVCLRCKTVRDIGPSPDTYCDEDFDFLDPEDHHRPCKPGGKLNASEDINKEEVNLTCPNCPDMTEDFFEKTFERDSLVLAVCPACTHVVFGNDTQAEATRDQRRTEAKNAPKFVGGRAQTARRTKQRFSVKMCNLGQRTPKPDSKDEDDMNVKQLMSRMGKEVGMTIGTEMGSIVQEHLRRVNASGPVGAVVKKAICEQLHRSAAKMGIACRNSP